MRRCIAGDGTDVSAIVQGVLLQTNAPQFTNLYRITPPAFLYSTTEGNSTFASFLLTDYDSPLYYNPPASNLGAFIPARISRGPIKFKVGFEADTMNLTWNLAATDILKNAANIPIGENVFSGFRNGRMDNAGVQLWRAVLKTPGDAVSYGAIEMFAGRIGPITIDRGKVTMQVKSFLEVLQTQVPTQLVEPGNRIGQAQLAAAGTGGPFLIIEATGTDLITLTDDGTNPLIPNDTFNMGYVAIGAPVNLYRTIRRNYNDGTHNIFKLYNPLPLVPPAGTQFGVNGLYPKDTPVGSTSPQLFGGFPFLPVPENSL